MNKIITVLIALIIIFPAGCKKGSDTGKDIALAKKYARYKAAVYKDKLLKTYMTALEKAEDVTLLDEEKSSDNKIKDISKIKLSDDSIGYTESRHLADAAIVFTTDTKAYIRPSSGSAVYAVIPKGELGFIIAEKGLWVQVFIGEISGKPITQQWVESGYSNDQKLVLEAKDYSAAIAGLNDKDPEKASQAKASLESISNGNSVIADMAREKLGLGKRNQPKNEEPQQNAAGD